MSVKLRLDTDRNRAQAKRWIDVAPSTTAVSFEDLANKRTGEQNDRLWVLLTMCQNLVKHLPTEGYGIWEDGMKFSKEDWKDYFCHSLSRSRWMPDENGGMVPLQLRTSKMDKQTHGDLQTLVEEFLTRMGVDIQETDQTQTGQKAA